MPNVQRETGIALPVTIFVITLLTITLAASFARVDADRAVAGGTEDAVTALALAESGLQSYMGSQTSRPADGDSVRINLAGGYADVVAHVVQKPLDPASPWMYILRSNGHVIVPEQGAVRQAARTVAQFAIWQTGVMRQFAAFTAANRVRDENPDRYTLDGRDECPDSANAWAAFTRGSSDLSDGTFYGAPPLVIQDDNDDDVADTTGVIWNTVLSGAFVPDYKSLVTGESLFKSQVIQGNVTLNNVSGTGLLAVTGNLTTSGTLVSWQGLILVGRAIDFSADSTEFYGMVISGLEAHSSVGGSPPNNARIGAKPVGIRYNSCHVRQSIAALTGFAAVRNAWVDNWATY